MIRLPKLSTLFSFSVGVIPVVGMALIVGCSGRPAELPDNGNEQAYVDQAVYVRSSRTDLCFAVWYVDTTIMKITEVECTDAVLAAIAEDSL